MSGPCFSRMRFETTYCAVFTDALAYAHPLSVWFRAGLYGGTPNADAADAVRRDPDVRGT